jgi:hypothetical protein
VTTAPPPSPVHACPHCGLTSAHPGDVTYSYCPRCDHRCVDVADRPELLIFDDRWIVPDVRVVVDNVRTPFHGYCGRVVRRGSHGDACTPAGMVLVRLDAAAPVGEVEFGTGELRPEVIE